MAEEIAEECDDRGCRVTRFPMDGGGCQTSLWEGGAFPGPNGRETVEVVITGR